MESPLSFDASENFRKKLLVRNLKPYGPEGFSTQNDQVAKSEIIIVDYPVIDSPAIETIAETQERNLYTKNIYTPDTTYGDTVLINLDLQKGGKNDVYDFTDTLNSGLENVGNQQETLHYVRNIYVPAADIGGGYGNSVDINTEKNVFNAFKGDVYDITDTIGAELETVGNTQEGFLYFKNQYFPATQGNEVYGTSRWTINNDLQELRVSIGGSIGTGEYTIEDTVKDVLETKGNFQEGFHYNLNQYTPPSLGVDVYGSSRYEINNNLQTFRPAFAVGIGATPGSGIYDINDTVNDVLEVRGNQEELFHYQKNQYFPALQGTDVYGSSRYIINNDLQTFRPAYAVGIGATPGTGVYTIDDTPNDVLEVVGNNQELFHYQKNQYFPPLQGTDVYGSSRYIINNDLQTFRPAYAVGIGATPGSGIYNLNDTENDVLEVRGNQEEGVAYAQNLYKPSNFGSQVYGTTTVKGNVDLQGQLFTFSTGFGLYDVTASSQAWIESNRLSIYGNDANDGRPKLYSFNQYVPENNYGPYRWDVNLDLQTGRITYADSIGANAGNGVYTIDDTINAVLVAESYQEAILLYNKNQYKPDPVGPFVYGTTKYNVNDDLDTGRIVFAESLGALPGSGIYNINDTIQSLLEVQSNLYEGVNYNENQYRPQSSPNIFYGDTKYEINDDRQWLRLSGQIPNSDGVYTLSDTEPSLLEIDGANRQISLFTQNFYKPENNPASSPYGTTTVKGNADLQGELSNNSFPNTNPGEYDITDAEKSRIEFPLFNQAQASYQINLFKPESGGSLFGPARYDVNTDEIIEVLKGGGYDRGEYGPYNQEDAKDSNLEIKGEQEQANYYGLLNKYNSGEGTYQVYEVENLPLSELINGPYANTDGSTKIFIPSVYSPYSILLQPDPKGSDGSISEDSNLMKISSGFLKREFTYRVISELVEDTLGRTNLVNSSVDPNNPTLSGIQVKPNTDPVDILGMATGNVPLFTRNWNVTVPDSIIGKTLNFAARLGGLTSPWSYIPDEYFPLSNKYKISKQGDVEVGAEDSKFSLFKIANDGTAGSFRFLQNTGLGTVRKIFDTLEYNLYRPDYRNSTSLLGNKFQIQPKFYVGDRSNLISNFTSDTAKPLDRFGHTINMAVYGYDAMYRDFEDKQDADVRVSDIKFGVTSNEITIKGDGQNKLKKPMFRAYPGWSLQGGFTWSSSKDSLPEIGKLAGREYTPYDERITFGTAFRSELEKTLSHEIKDSFEEGSLLRYTQSLIDSASNAEGSERLRHVGHAMNQISKVFNDGYVELTKGSRVIRYLTPNAVQPNPKVAGVEGYEYCRVHTKDDPYYTFTRLVKTEGITVENRRFTYSVLDKTYNLNIAPMKGNANMASTNITPDGKVKKYMFSLENLAWRTSNRPGYRYDDLPTCEKGPNGGRIMWFPPYDISFGESVSTQWNDNVFVGRTEPIFTYSNTKRTGKLSWKLVVDHPAILNAIVDKELKKARETESQFTEVIASFFAGCLKYDVYELAKQFPTIDFALIEECVVLINDQVVRTGDCTPNPIKRRDIILTLPPEPSPTPLPCTVWDWKVENVQTDLVYTACGKSQVILSGLTNTGGTVCVERGTVPEYTVTATTNTLTLTDKLCEPSPTPTPTPTPTPECFVAIWEVGSTNTNVSYTGCDGNIITYNSITNTGQTVCLYPDTIVELDPSGATGNGWTATTGPCPTPTPTPTPTADCFVAIWEVGSTSTNVSYTACGDNVITYIGVSNTGQTVCLAPNTIVELDPSGATGNGWTATTGPCPTPTPTPTPTADCFVAIWEVGSTPTDVSYTACGNTVITYNGVFNTGQTVCLAPNTIVELDPSGATGNGWTATTGPCPTPTPTPTPTSTCFTAIWEVGSTPTDVSYTACGDNVITYIGVFNTGQTVCLAPDTIVDLNPSGATGNGWTATTGPCVTPTPTPTPTEPPCSNWDWSVDSVQTNLTYTACNGSQIVLSALTFTAGTVCVEKGTVPEYSVTAVTNTLIKTTIPCTPTPTPTPSPTFGPDPFTEFINLKPALYFFNARPSEINRESKGQGEKEFIDGNINVASNIKKIYDKTLKKELCYNGSQNRRPCFAGEDKATYPYAGGIQLTCPTTSEGAVINNFQKNDQLIKDNILPYSVYYERYEKTWNQTSMTIAYYGAKGDAQRGVCSYPDIPKEANGTYDTGKYAANRLKVSRNSNGQIGFVYDWSNANKPDTPPSSIAYIGTNLAPATSRRKYLLTKEYNDQYHPGKTNFFRDYVDQTEVGIKNFWDTVIKANYEKFDKILEQALVYLQSGNELSLSLAGSCSASFHSKTYNDILAKRRIESVYKQIYNKEIQPNSDPKNTMKYWIDNKKFIINRLPLGMDAIISIPGTDYQNIDCQKPYTVVDGGDIDSSGIYSVNAMACRRVDITEFKITKFGEQPASTTNPNPNSGNNNVPSGTGQGGDNSVGPNTTGTDGQQNGINAGPGEGTGTNSGGNVGGGTTSNTGPNNSTAVGNNPNAQNTGTGLITTTNNNTNGLNGVVTLLSIVTNGTGYVDNSSVNTINGSGSELKVTTTTTSGTITNVTVSSGGKNYLVGEIVTVTGGNGDATLRVEKIANNVSTTAGSSSFTSASSSTTSSSNATAEVSNVKDQTNAVPDEAKATPDAISRRNTLNPPLPEEEIENNPETIETRKKFVIVKETILKKLVRGLLNECNYFEMLSETNPMIYNGMKEKLKYFEPAFHALTPEGLNGRLTFLQQCMRPGDTIPTVIEKNGVKSLTYKDAQNSAFGAPPICILRFGDFFHTKIAIDSLSLDYKDNLLDLNPEGIGVQPMIAEVSINFNFIGGHGLKEPVSRLQNALSFNYYANTEIYDDRAIETDKAPEATEEDEEQINNNLGINTVRNNENEAGEPIGTIESAGFLPGGNQVSGIIEYTTFMGKLPTYAQNYFKTTYDSLKKLNEDLYIGGLQLISNDRLYTSGVTDNKNTNIFGTPSLVQKKVETLFKLTKQDVDDDKCPILPNLGVNNYTALLSKSDKRKVKRKIKNMVDERLENYITKISEAITKINEVELSLIKQIDKINYVVRSRDGYKTDSGNWVIYETYDNTPQALQTLKSDLEKLRLDINNFVVDLGLGNILRPQVEYNDFTFEVYFSGVPTPTPTAPLPTPTPTATLPVPTATATATPTPTATATATPTPTATATATPTPTPTATPVPTATTMTFQSCCVPSTIFNVTDIPLIENITVGQTVYIFTNSPNAYCATRITSGTPAVTFTYVTHDEYDDCNDCISNENNDDCFPVPTPTPTATATPTPTPTTTGPIPTATATPTPTPTPSPTPPTPLSLPKDAEIRFFLVFGKELLDNPPDFIEEVISVVDNLADRNNWRQYLQYSVGLTDLFTDRDTLLKKYNRSLDATKKFFTDFENLQNYLKYKDASTYKPYNLSTERKMGYVSQVPTNDSDADDLDAIYFKNSTGKLFNLKKSFISD